MATMTSTLFKLRHSGRQVELIVKNPPPPTRILFARDLKKKFAIAPTACPLLFMKVIGKRRRVYRYRGA